MRRGLVLLPVPMLVAIAFAAAPAAAAEPAPVTVKDGAANLNLEVTAGCKDKAVEFLIVNTGEPWPALARMSVLPVGEEKPVSSRQLRLTTGQKVSFKVKDPADKAYGLLIEPSWTQGSVTLDAKASCR